MSHLYGACEAATSTNSVATGRVQIGFCFIFKTEIANFSLPSCAGINHSSFTVKRTAFIQWVSEHQSDLLILLHFDIHCQVCQRPNLLSYAKIPEIMFFFLNSQNFSDKICQIVEKIFQNTGREQQLGLMKRWPFFFLSNIVGFIYDSI